MVLMSSKLLFSFGMLASNESDCSQKKKDEAQNRRHACVLGGLVKIWQAEFCVYADGVWIPGGLGQRTPSGLRPVAGGNPQLKYPWMAMANFRCFHMSGLCTNPNSTTWFLHVWHRAFDQAEPPYHYLPNSDSNTLSLSVACMRTWLKTIDSNARSEPCPWPNENMTAILHPQPT